MVRIELTGSDTATACGLTAVGRSPVLKLCRMLVTAGHDPAEPAEAYRGSTLCLHIRSIGEGAGLAMAETGGPPRFVPYVGGFPTSSGRTEENPDEGGAGCHRVIRRARRRTPVQPHENT
jgi:hypothetical protein